MKAYMVRLTMALVLLVMMSSAGLAELLPREDVPVAVNIPQWVILEVTPAALEFEEEDFDFETATVDDAGVTAVKEEALELRSAGNIPYSITISVPTDQPSFRHTTLPEIIPVGNMRWGITPLSGTAGILSELTDQGVVIESYDSAGRDRSIPLDFDLLVNWENPAGSYEGIVLFTVVPGEPNSN